MKTLRKWIAVPACALLIIPGIVSLAQGPLTPPGPPAPTMKSLDQIEPRTPISSIPFTISQPGSYFLTGNLTLPAGDSGADGITIAVDNVTLDLGGFTLFGAGIGNNGIFTSVSTAHSIRIRNGNVQQWGSGISAMCKQNVVEYVQAWDNSAYGINITNGEVSHCIANSNGFAGILGSYCIVSYCTTNNNGSYGISFSFSEISHCAANYNLLAGISVVNCNVNDCGVSNNPVGFTLSYSTIRGSRTSQSTDRGIDTRQSTVEGCAVTQNHWGIVASESNVNHNVVADSDSDGIRADNSGLGGCAIADNKITQSGLVIGASGIYIESNGNRVVNNNISTTQGDGIGVTGVANFIDGNGSFNNTNYGINILNSGNTIVRNSTQGNGGGTYSIVAGNNVGPADPAVSSTHSWSNLQ